MKKFGLFTGPLELSRTTCRVLVFVMYGAYLELIAHLNLSYVMRNNQLSIAGWLTLMGFIVFTISYFVLIRSTRGLAERVTVSPIGKASLDERQILLRNRAYFYAYLIIGVAMFFFAGADNNLGYWWPLFSFIGFYVSLPTALIAWLEPDPLSEEVASNLPRESKTA